MKKQFLFSIVLLLFVGKLLANFSLQNLQTNYQTTPLGTDLATPQYSWQMKALDAKRGYKQKAYQIVVTDEQGKIVWNGQKVNSDVAHAIQYAGEALKPTTHYTWNLTVWDNFGASTKAASWFETGFLNPKIEALSGAQWIGGGDEDVVFYSPYQSVFKFQYGIQLDKTSNSTKAAFVFGANDSRMMNKNLNLMGRENGKNESYVAVELDISNLSENTEGSAKLNIYRVGYDKNDKADVPFKSINISLNIVNNANKYEKHTIYAECVCGIFEFFVDGSDKNHTIKDASMEPNSPFGQRGLNLNPVGAGNNFISFPMVADIGFKSEANQKSYFSDIQIRNYRSPSNILFSENLNNVSSENSRVKVTNSIFSPFDIDIENQKYVVQGNTLTTANPSRNAAPMLRSVFNIAEKKVKKARLYVTARGIYEVFLNEKRISNEYFNPGLTQYNKNHAYQTYDITDALSKGQNAIGAWLSEGWWSGNITYNRDIYQRRFCTILLESW